VKIKFDPAKSERNARLRGLPFSIAENFDFGTALVWQDARHAYPEVRWLAIGFVEARLHVLCYCDVNDGFRVISFRKANARERRRYDEARSG
jgi:uncharacterized DUF497 family protein